jgi:hypothetical protein
MLGRESTPGENATSNKSGRPPSIVLMSAEDWKECYVLRKLQRGLSSMVASMKARLGRSISFVEFSSFSYTERTEYSLYM